MSKSNANDLKTIQKIYNPLAGLPEVEQEHYSETSIILKSDIVRDILDGSRKIFIRPTICKEDFITPEMEYLGIGLNPENFYHAFFSKPGIQCHYLVCTPYSPGEVVFVRESFCCLPVGLDGRDNGKDNYYYRADGDFRPIKERWQSPSHMPKEAARIWLRMNTSSVQRLQSITMEDAIAAGIISARDKDEKSTWKKIAESWNNMLSLKDINNHNDWDSNPWVWIIRFERINYHRDQEMITWRQATVNRYREEFRKKVELRLIKDLDRIDCILPDMSETKRTHFALHVKKMVADRSAGHWRFVKLNDNENDDMPCYGVVFLFTYRKVRCMYGWDPDKSYLGFFSIIQDDDIKTERYISLDDIED